jgi:hypothetical protein
MNPYGTKIATPLFEAAGRCRNILERRKSVNSDAFRYSFGEKRIAGSNPKKLLRNSAYSVVKKKKPTTEDTEEHREKNSEKLCVLCGEKNIYSWN